MADPKTISNETLIYTQIEASAQYYPPVIYDALTRFGSFQTETDAEAANYIPLTTAQQGLGQQATFLPFACGIIPPAVKITGRTLDRSATVASYNGGAQPVGFSAPTNQSSARGHATGMNNGGSPTYQAMTPLQKANAVYEAYTRLYGMPPDITTLRMLVAQTLVEQPGAWPDFNPGGVGASDRGPRPNSFSSTSSAAPGTYYFNSYATAGDGAADYVGTVGRCGALPAAAAGDPKAYAQALGKANYFGPGSVSAYASGVSAHYREMLSAIPDIASVLGATPPGGSNIVGGDASSGSWADTGSGAASDSKKTSSKLTDKDLNTSELGKRLLDQQQIQIKALNQAVQDMAKIPPLQMLVSPTSFKYSAEKIVSDGNWGRNGPIIEHWGNQQEKIEGSGKLAAFYAIDTSGAPSGGDGSKGNGPGLTRTARNFSLSYQNFLSLYLLYKSNGGVWLTDYFSTTKTSKPVNLSLVGSIYLYYDNTLYIGSFDNFSITEDASAPFTLDYSFSFTVRAWFLLDTVPDPRFSYTSTGSTTAVKPNPTTSAPSPTTAADTGGGPAYGASATDVADGV